MANDEILSGGDEFPDLAPSILRQRLVIEGTCAKPVDAEAVCKYLEALSDACGMRALMAPMAHRSERFGWAGWIHWETSGAHFYAWETPIPFFSVDIYTCKAFDPVGAVRFTREFFSADQIVAKAF